MASLEAPDPLARTWAVVPLRGLESAKTRLAPELDAEERLTLVTEMAQRTLAACRDARLLAGTVLVTLDPEAAALAETFGARTLVQRLPGLNAAIREARSAAIRGGATAILVVPIDLPGISADALDDVIGTAHAAVGTPAVGARPASSARSIVALVPDRHGTGTNALLVSPAEAIEPAFGPGSRALHRESADEADATYVELGGPLTFDVDTASDLLAVGADDEATTAHA
jgi:2-phospho-L-lactate guanylyltransferase